MPSPSSTPAPTPDPLAVLILGPTGSGKTALSLALAGRFNGEVISCDSVSVYRGLDIGSAKPTAEEQQQIPHHLIDVAEPDQFFTAGEYSRQARAAMHQITARHRLPIITGGTGLYLRALTLGLFDGPIRQPELRNRLLQSQTRHSSAASPSWLHRILSRLDPPSAQRIHPNDTPKLIRAIEICLTAKQPLSAAFAAGRDALTGYSLLRIGLNPPRQQLNDRLNQRAAAMFENGLIEETRRLLARYGPVPPLDSLGYRQAAAILNGAMTPEEALTAARQGHRQYAKRQLTWFRREPDVLWLPTFGDDPQTLASASAFLTRHPGPTSNL